MKFRLLRAEILSYKGGAPEISRLLACDSLSFPATGDILIKRDILCAQEQAPLGNFSISDHDIDEARNLSAATHSSLQGELLRMEALIADEYKNQQDASIGFYKDSLQAAKKSGDTFLESSDLLNLGMVALEQDRFVEALDLFAQSSTLAEKIQARQDSQAALGNTGLAYLNLGDYVRALSNFQQAEKEAVATGVINDQVTWLWDEGVSYYHLGKPDEAEATYELALELARKIHNVETIVGINTGLGFLMYEKGQYALALYFSNDAVRAAQAAQDRDAAIEPLFLQALVATHKSDAHAAELQLLEIHTKSAGDSEVRSLTEQALGNFYNSRHEIKKAAFWYQTAIHTFEAQRAAVKAEELKLPFFANAEAIYRDYASFLIGIHRVNEALNLLDEGRAQTLSEGLSQSTPQPRHRHATFFNAQATAKKVNATLLFYALGPEKSCLWAVDAHQIKLFTLPKASELESAVQSYNKSLLKSSDPLRQQDRNAAFLYQSLIGPAASMIPLNASVVIIPDGALNQLNFETLIVPGAGASHYWIEDVTLTNASSIRMLTRGFSHSTTAARENLLLVGDPTTSGTGFDPLPHAAAEMVSVEKQFPKNARTIVAQSAAIPSSYAASQPEQFGYIHFVAHGTASLLSPLDSAVILSPTPEHPETFKLYARDIVHHPIHAQLVTISACNGSGLRAYAGEGLVGLSWAFLRAGAHNVIGALWQVDDAATPLIMDRLYADLRVQHATPDVALRNAKLALIHSRGVYRKPLYWAAFQLYTGS